MEAAEPSDFQRVLQIAERLARESEERKQHEYEQAVEHQDMSDKTISKALCIFASYEVSQFFVKTIGASMYNKPSISLSASELLVCYTLWFLVVYLSSPVLVAR